MTWDDRLASLWESIDDLPEDDFIARMDELTGELSPDSAIGAFERAAALDSTGRPDRAVPLYRQALETGLEGERRRRAVIQMASSLRNLGRPEREREATALALGALAPHLPRYQRSLANYARAIGDG
jgi:hypothetical protein